MSIFRSIVLTMIIMAGLCGSAQAENNAVSSPLLELTPAEKLWLAAHPDIVLGYTDSLEPAVIADPNGKHTGMLVDALEQLNRCLGTRIKLRLHDIPTVLENAKNKKVDGILALHPEYAEGLGLLPTKAYWPEYLAVFARRGTSFKGPEDFTDKRVALIDDIYITRKMIEEHGKQTTIVNVKTALEGLRAVARGDADLFLGGSFNSYFLTKYQLLELVQAHVFFDPPAWQCIAVRADWPELVTILNKGLATFSAQEIHDIIRKWSYLPPDKPHVDLTTEERAWLGQNHTVRVRVTEWPPFMGINENGPWGISVDSLKLIGERTGLRLEFIPETRPFYAALESMKDGQGPDVIPNTVRTPERERFFSFSRDYYSAPRVIYVRTGKMDIQGMDDLSGKSIATVSSTVVAGQLAAQYPEVDLQFYDTDDQCLAAVAQEKADAYIGNLTLASYIILENGLTNLKVAAPGPFEEHVLAYCIRRDWPELSRIINKGLDSITPAERAAIRNKYLTVRYEYGILPGDVVKWVAAIGTVALAIVFLFIFWNRRLKYKVVERAAELVEREERLRATFEQAAVGIAHVALDGSFLRINQRFCDIVGYGLDEMLARTFQEITHPDDLTADVAQVQRLLSGEGDAYSIEKRYIRKNGSLVWINLTVSLIRDEAGRPQWFVSVVEDISKRKQSEKALSENEAKFCAVIEQSPVSIQIHGLDGKLITSNEAYSELYALNENALAQLYEKYNILQDEQAKRLGLMPCIEKVYAGGDVVFPPYEYDGIDTLKTLDFENPVSRRCWIQTRGFPLKNEAGQVTSAVFMSVDFTEQKQGEKQLKLYQDRLRALALDLTLTEERERRRIASELHDGAAQSLAFARIQLASSIKAVSDPEVAGKLDDLSQLLKESLQQIRQVLLDLSSPALNEIGLAAALSEWLEEHVGRRHGLRVTFADRSGKVPLTDDMRAVFFRNARELLMNVVKHAKATQISVSMTASDESLRLTVQDDGEGFDPEAVAQRPTRDGAFGVFSIRERMSDMGGALEIDSAPGKGGKATLIMPLASDEERNSA